MSGKEENSKVDRLLSKNVEVAIGTVGEETSICSRATICAEKSLSPKGLCIS